MKKEISRRSFLTISAMAAMFLAVDRKKLAALAEQIKPKKDYPVVVIGAGLGGLCAASYLAKEGFPVTVVEQHFVPGGYATSFSRGTGDKYTFEVSLHGTALNNTPAARVLEDLGVLKNIKLVLAPECYKIKTQKIDIPVPQKNPGLFIEQLGKMFPDEKQGVKSFVDEMIGVADNADKLAANKGKYNKMLFPLQYKHMWNVRNKTLKELLNEHVRNPDLQEVLAGLWGYYGLPPSKLSAFYYTVATGEYLKHGSYYIRERSQNLSNALADVVEKNGGKIIYGTEAVKILTRKEGVQGVEVSGGKKIPARVVVSNANAPDTLLRMLPDGSLPDDYLGKIKGYRSSMSTFNVWLGLNKDLRGITKSYSTHISSGDPDKEYEACVNGDIEKCPLAVNVYDNLFEGYSKPGCSTISILSLCGYDFWQKFEADYKRGQKTAYYKEKERWTKILIKRAEQSLIPGLSSMIEVTESATPLTNWFFTRNDRGAIYGYDESVDNSFMNRIENHTPVKGLYLASAWGNPGGGYSGVLRGGFNTFSRIMEDLAGS